MSKPTDYTRLTPKDLTVALNLFNHSEDNTYILLCISKLWELENRIEDGRIVFKEEADVSNRPESS